VQAPAIAHLQFAVPEAPATRHFASPVEVLAQAVVPDPILLAPLSTPVPALSVSEPAALSMAGFQPCRPTAAVPAATAWNPHAAVLQLMSTLPAAPKPVQPPCEPAMLPPADFFPTEYYLQRGSGAPVVATEWKLELPERAMMPFGLTVVKDRWDEPTTVVRKPAAEKVAKVTELKKRPSKAPAYLGKIAACVVAGLALWYGVHTMRPGDQGTTQVAVNSTPAVAAPAPSSVDAKPASTGMFASVRRAIASRAAVELSDNFHGGMEAWGASRALPAGWSRNREGYMHPGDLALFHPSMNFKDYRVEFLGQVENKSMDWVVRAHDKQNYYGMKVSVIESGLRPIIALTHYSVVNGRKGNKVETPLNVMVHNNTPIRVAVDISGNRFTTSIEGQQVDSWSDAALVAGGVGFFSEAGSKARLYWMKVSKNTDWLGTICSYLSSDTQETASIDRPQIPPAPGAPFAPAMAALLPWPASSRRRRAGTTPFLMYRRSGRWNS
jgi:hypothetical protein